MNQGFLPKGYEAVTLEDALSKPKELYLMVDNFDVLSCKLVTSINIPSRGWTKAHIMNNRNNVHMRGFGYSTSFSYESECYGKQWILMRAVEYEIN
jgi:hypothetical protein